MGWWVGWLVGWWVGGLVGGWVGGLVMVMVILSTISALHFYIIPTMWWGGVRQSLVVRLAP